MIVYIYALGGAGLFALGWWGSYRVASLVPPMLPAIEREKRRREMRRGAVVLQIFGLFVVVLSVIGIINGP